MGDFSARFIPASLQIRQRIFRQNGHTSCTQHNKACNTFLARPEEAADRVQQCVSSDSIPTGPEVTSQMRLQENIKCFDQKGQ